MNSMTYEDVIKRLESINLPIITQEGHRRQLREALLKEYSRIEARYEEVGLLEYLRSHVPIWKAILITASACVIIAIIISLSVLIPMNSTQSVTAKAIDIVLASQEVKAALTNDEIATVLVTDIGNNWLEVMIESRGGTILIARVDTNNNTVVIKEITCIILLGSPYDTPENITGEERDQALNLAGTNRDFQQLLNAGASINKITAIYCITSTRYMDTGKIIENRERWSWLQLELEGKYFGFLIDISGGRIIFRK